MSELRKAAQQALEALEKSSHHVIAAGGSGWKTNAQRCDRAMEALRAALAQPEQEKKIGCVQHDCDVCQARALAQPEQAPVAWSDARLRGIASDYFPDAKDWPAAMLCLRHLLMEQAKYPPASALEQPEQEPVAWMYHGVRFDDTPHDSPSLIWRPEYMDAMSASKGAKAAPLYTAPPRREWRGLAEEDEIPWDGVDVKSFAKAIEAKLKEKNNG